VGELGGAVVSPFCADMLDDLAEAAFRGLFRFFGEVLLEFILRPLLILISWIVATPLVLIGAAFDEGAYWSNVRERYAAIARWWLS
jgi:hypothetical protein